MPTFGQTIRAARLGFQWSAEMEAMIQICLIGGGAYAVAMCPPDQLPKGVSASECICWWETEDPAGFLRLSPAIQRNRAPKSMVRFTVNDEGEIYGEKEMSPASTNPGLASARPQRSEDVRGSELKRLEN